jgi:hypothetical protein
MFLSIRSKILSSYSCNTDYHVSYERVLTPSITLRWLCRSWWWVPPFLERVLAVGPRREVGWRQGRLRLRCWCSVNVKLCKENRLVWLGQEQRQIDTLLSFFRLKISHACPSNISYQPPTLSLAGEGDRILGNPHDVLRSGTCFSCLLSLPCCLNQANGQTFIFFVHPLPGLQFS